MTSNLFFLVFANVVYLTDIATATDTRRDDGSWERLWKRVFSDVESAEFAEKHLRVRAKATDNWGRGGVVHKSTSGSVLLYWSVELV